MWPMIASPGLRCAECRHDIRAGRLCLSELPEEMPSGVSRGDFKNYCIGCPECWAKGHYACYPRHLEDRRLVEKAPHSLPCSRCGLRIGAGDSVCSEVYYEWPEMCGDESPTKRNSLAMDAAIAGAAYTKLRGIPESTFEDLSKDLKDKFSVYVGEHDADSYYRSSVPSEVRNLGEKAIKEFIEGKDQSHVISQHNHPEHANDYRNLVWEDSSGNRSRGALDMTDQEYREISATNAFEAKGIVFRTCLDAAAATALSVALFEAPWAALENLILKLRRQKTGTQALLDASKSIIRASASAFPVGFAVTGAIALGAGPLLITISPVLQSVGIVLYGYKQFKRIKRIKRAFDHGMPLHRVSNYFCSPRCHTKFAYDTGYSALMRWEEGRIGSLRNVWRPIGGSNGG